MLTVVIAALVFLVIYLYMRFRKNWCVECRHHRDRHGVTTGQGCITLMGCRCVIFQREELKR